MRLIEKIILLLLGISLVPLAIIGSFFYASIKTTLQDETAQRLSSIATLQEHHLVEIRNQNLSRLADFTSRRQLRAQLKAYNQAPSQAAANNILSILEDAKSLGKDIGSIIVMDPAGAVVASTDGQTVATQLEAAELYRLGSSQNAIKLGTKAGSQDTVFYLSGPLLIDDKKIGIIGLEISASSLIETITDSTGLGKTGEIYLGTKQDGGQLAYITPQRFKNPSANLAITDTAAPMHKALMGEEGIFPHSTDYRGHEVLAATRSIEDSGWGLVAKIDRSEALLPLNRLRSELILLAFINSVLVVFVAIALARRLTQPILDIDEVAEQTSKGNLKSRIAHPTNDEIGNLAGTFNEMLDNLEVLDKAKSDFVSLASHQLRTPLTSIKWASEELMHPKFIRKNKIKQKHYLQQIHASNERMIELVNALLNVSKIDVGTLPFKKESVDLVNSLDQVISDLDVLLRTKNITINKKIDENLISVAMDPSWIRVIFQNLISNAIRYSPPNRHVDIRMEQQKNHVLFQVKDKGYGIPVSQQDKIFKKFFRADNAQRLGSDGSGLGLYITKAMVDRAGGAIWFDSTQNRGTVFYVKIPSDKTSALHKGGDGRGRSS